MKRLLLYIVLTALSALPLTNMSVLADTPPKPPTKAVITQTPAPATTVASQPVTVVTPTPVAVVPATPVFDPNNPATWPTCGADQVVWASDGQCHDKAVETVTPTVTAVATPSVATGGCGDNSYAQYMYEHESGCSTTVENAGGCLGIGQACPGSKLLAICPDEDYTCENAFFTAYAAKYGGWAGAYDFWVSHGWW
jgi:hypothetical protein